MFMNNMYMCIKRVYNVLMYIICTFTVHDVIVCVFIQINGFTNFMGFEYLAHKLYM